MENHEALNNPFKDAQIAWHMATPTASENYPVDLEVYGQPRARESQLA